MPIRSNLALALTLTGAIACGLAIQAQAQSPGLVHLAQQDDDDDDNDNGKERDLRPVPSSKGRPRVTLIPSTKVVPIGGWVNFRVSSSVTGYGHIYVMSASGRAQVWMENVPIVGGQRLVFPIGRIGIKAAAPAGREDLMLIVTRKRINGFFGYDTTRTPSVVEHDHRSFKAALTAMFIKMPKQQWSFARTSVRVVDRSSPTGPTWGWGKAGPSYWENQFETDRD
jgi:hypothetical protein